MPRAPTPVYFNEAMNGFDSIFGETDRLGPRVSGMMQKEQRLAQPSCAEIWACLICVFSKGQAESACKSSTKTGTLLTNLARERNPTAQALGTTNDL